MFWGRSNGMVDTYITLCSVEPICGIGPDPSVRPTPKDTDTYPIRSSSKQKERLDAGSGEKAGGRV